MDNERKARLKKSDIGYGYDSPFPERLRFLMESDNITQDSLAEYLGIARQSVAQWKDGKTKPDIYFLDKIADFFRVSTDYLLGRTEDFKGDADVMAVEKRLGLSSISQDNLESISYSDFYTGGLDVLNLLLESEFLNELELEMRKYILQRHIIKYYEKKYCDIIQMPIERTNMIDMTLEQRIFNDYQEEITKGEFHLFVAQQNVLKVLRRISEKADKSFNMSEFINDSVAAFAVKRIEASEEFHKKTLKIIQDAIDESTQGELEMTEGMRGSSDRKWK